MNNLVTVVFCVILSITLHSGKCNSLDIDTNNSEVPARWIRFIKNRRDNNIEDVTSGSEEAVHGNKRVIRQANYNQHNIYPTLQPYQNPGGNQNPQNNQWQHGNNNPQSYPTNGYSSTSPYGSNPSNFSSNSQWQHGNSGSPQVNGYRPNNPYGTNYSQSGYPSPQGYRPSNFSSNNPSAQHGQNSWQPNQGQSPYQQTTPYPGFKPGNNYNPSSRPPYYQPGQPNNTYSGYPPYGQSTPRPGYQNPVIYNNSTRQPGQNPYGSFNSSNFNNGQKPGQNPYGSPSSGSASAYPYNSPGQTQYGPGQNPYSYPGSSQYPGNTNPGSSQYPSNGYTGANQYPGSGPVNTLPNGQIPGPYSSYPGGPHPNGPYDPTKVSPQHFNSY